MGVVASMRKEADRALGEHFVPRLREMGFRGSGQHFRRILEDRIDLVTVQFGKWDGSFCVNIAICPPGGPPETMGRGVPPNKVTAFDIFPVRRRLTMKDGQSDCWFRYYVGDGFGPHEFDGTPDECAIAAVAALVSRGEAFFQHSDRWWLRPGAQ